MPELHDNESAKIIPANPGYFVWVKFNNEEQAFCEDIIAWEITTSFDLTTATPISINGPYIRSERRLDDDVFDIAVQSPHGGYTSIRTGRRYLTIEQWLEGVGLFMLSPKTAA